MDRVPFLGRADVERPSARAGSFVRQMIISAAALFVAFCAGALWAGGSGDARVRSGRAWSRLAFSTEGPHMPTADRFRNNLVFSDEFDELDTAKWKHEITMSAGGNWEFQWYTNNRVSCWYPSSLRQIEASDRK